MFDAPRLIDSARTPAIEKAYAKMETSPTNCCAPTTGVPLRMKWKATPITGQFRKRRACLERNGWAGNVHADHKPPSSRSSAPKNGYRPIRWSTVARQAEAGQSKRSPSAAPAFSADLHETLEESRKDQESFEACRRRRSFTISPAQ